MKLIVAGGRDYRLSEDDLKHLKNIEGVTEVVTGGASGVDSDAEAWAASHNIPVKRFKPDWKKYRSAAGPIRNREMAKYADAVVIFPGDKGTDSMRQEAVKEKISIYGFSR